MQAGRKLLRSNMMRYMLILLLLNGCASSGILRGSGEVAPAPVGHVKLCAEQPDFPGCPK